MYRTFSSTIQPTNHRTGCLDLYNFHVAAQNPVISKPIVILLFSERSSLRCIVQPDGGSWHPKCLMNNSTKNAAPVHSFLKSTLPHYPLGTKPLYPLDVINGEFQNQWCHFGEEFLAAFGSVTPHPMPYKIISSLWIIFNDCDNTNRRRYFKIISQRVGTIVACVSTQLPPTDCPCYFVTYQTVVGANIPVLEYFSISYFHGTQGFCCCTRTTRTLWPIGCGPAAIFFYAGKGSESPCRNRLLSKFHIRELLGCMDQTWHNLIIKCGNECRMGSDNAEEIAWV